MGRGDNATANKINQQNATTGNQLIQGAVPQENAAIGNYANQVNSILANNPYTDPTYLANVRSAASNVESGAQNAGNTNLENYAARSGENSGNVIAAEEEGARESARRQHGILTQQAIQDYGTRQNQIMEATAMLGQIPGMYNPQISAGEGLATGAGSSETQLAGQPSWFDSLINAGVSAAGTAVGAACCAKGTLIAMFDGTKKPIEQLVVGDKLLGADGGTETLLNIESREQETFLVICNNGAWVKCSGSHTLAISWVGYTTAKESTGFLVMTDSSRRIKNCEASMVESVIPEGKCTVYKLYLDRTHSYLSQGIWSIE